MTGPVLELREVSIAFGSAQDAFVAASRVSFSVQPGETFAIVGESGSGKTVTALSVLGLIEAPGRVAGGEIRLSGVDLLTLSERQMREIRGRDVAMVFQDPMTTLHPMLRIEEQMVDAILAHRRLSKRAARLEAAEGLARVGIPSPDERLRAYTRALLDAAPKVGRRRAAVPALKGEIPSPITPPGGCPFHPRCPAAMPVCKDQEPPPVNLGRTHWAACHLHQSPVARAPHPSGPPDRSIKAESSSC
jgi:oligopeptide/dipeptide ABC transporter ATP-binding protein